MRSARGSRTLGHAALTEATAEQSLRFVDLRDLEPQVRRDLCLRFYDGLYRDAFPKAAQAESPDVWLPLLESEGPGGHVLHMVLALRPSDDHADAGPPEILGGALVEHFPRSEVALLTYLCVAHEARGHGLARELVEHASSASAKHVRGGHQLLLAEIEDANVAPPGSADYRTAMQRYRVFDALGFRALPYPYRQPPLAAGLPWVEDLLLIVHAPDGRRTVPRARLVTFLDELAESLGVVSDETVPRPTTERGRGLQATDEGRIESGSLIELLATEERPTLGQAGAVTVRYTFFQPPEALRPDLDLVNPGPAQGRPTAIDDLVSAVATVATPTEFTGLIEPMQSFIWDITLSEEGSRRLPLVTPCVARGDLAPAPEVIIHFPPVIVTRWEGTDVETVLGPSERTLVAHLVDSVAVFATNHVGYLLSLVMKDPEGGQGVTLRTSQLVALMALVETDSKSARGAAVPLVDAIEFELDGARMRLPDLATTRLRDLASAVEGTGAVNLVLGALASTGGKGRDQDVRAAIARFATMDEGLLFGVTCEIQDFDRMAEVEATIEAARAGTVRCNEFTRQLAGLAQGVIDHHEQDRGEVEDSLELASVFGGSVHFIQRRAAVRLSGSTRSYEKMRAVIGGCPYFLLATQCAMFNERLVSSAAREVARLRPSPVRRSRWISLDGRHTADELVRIERRFLFYERFFAETIPNLFRYQSERRLFEELEAKRGMIHQRDQGRSVLDQIDEYWRSRNQQAQEWIDSLLATAIFGLTLWQVFGVTWEAGRDAAGDFRVLDLGFQAAGTLSSFVAVPLLAVAVLVSARFLRSLLTRGADRVGRRSRVTIVLLILSLVLMIGAVTLGAVTVPGVPGRS